MAEYRAKVKATETSFRIVELIREHEDIAVAEIAREMGVAKSGVHKHLQTLVHLGYLYQDDNGYHLSNQFRTLCSSAAKQLPVETARQVVDDLAETTGHASNFIAHEHDRGVYVVCRAPDREKEFHSAGEIAPLHASAGGKAILAFLSSHNREAILDQYKFTEYTPKTITEQGELEKQLQSIRDRQVAFDRQERRENHQCVASPVLGGDGDPIGAVSVTGDISQMSGKRLEEDVVGLVTSAAQSIRADYFSQ